MGRERRLDDCGALRANGKDLERLKQILEERSDR